MDHGCFYVHPFRPEFIYSGPQSKTAVISECLDRTDFFAGHQGGFDLLFLCGCHTDKV